MKINITSITCIMVIVLLQNSCKEQGHEEHNNIKTLDNEETHSEVKGRKGQTVHLSRQQFKAMDIKVDSLPLRILSGLVEVNGQLEVPPQNEAAITAIIGANVISIKVIEGDKVRKGQSLAYLSHPDLINLQTEYSNNFNKLNYLEEDYKRQKRLYDEGVASGKQFQQVRSDYRTTQGMVKGIESQLGLLGLNLEQIKKGKIYSQVPVTSPIDGYVEKVNIKLGQYVPQQKELFEIVNTDHVHADLMVFEKDVNKVKKGQRVALSIESLPDLNLQAKIYSVGKTFETDPKAVHIHAEIENKKGHLFPGMYITGKIATTSNRVTALPEEAIVNEDGASHIFKAEKVMKAGEEEWIFSLLKVITGEVDDGWIEIKLMDPLEPNEEVAWNNAYYLVSEMKKGEAKHSH